MPHEPEPPTRADPEPTGPYTPPPAAGGPDSAAAEGSTTPAADRPASAALPDYAGRYQVLGEIARGGMGAVLRGHDPDLHRPLAIKVLLEHHHGDAALARRFLEEARISGQLQHPGVVPVHEVGTLADGRPFFAMKLVEGRTLAELLKDRAGPADNPERYLEIFEKVCQTIAYAHSRGVIHRDLKPSNVMVGAFGEVQVMDWGLAKVIGRERPEAEGGAGEAEVVRVVRGGPDGSGSEAGAVLGTPAYMAPEQARGEVDSLDERCDVFGLGGILCVTLTGKPPYEGPTRDELFRRAAAADLGDARERLAGCGADGELVRLALACLAEAPAERPRDAGVVAEALTAYRAGVEGRLRQAELARAAAQARAAEERKARRLTAAVAALALALVALGWGGWAWLERERARQLAGRREDMARAVNGELQEAALWLGQARGAAVTDLAPWEAAARAGERARERLQGEAPDELRRRVEDFLATLYRDKAHAEQEAAAARRDGQMLQRVADVRSGRGDEFDPGGADADYARAFRSYDLDPEALPPGEAATRVHARPAGVAAELAAALDDWALDLRQRKQPAARWRRLLTVAREMDPDPWRARLRQALADDDTPALRELARAEVSELPVASLTLLGSALAAAGDIDGAVAWLRQAQRLHPGDVWVNYHLAGALRGKAGGLEEALRYYAAARAVRPEVAHALAHALDEKGERAEAVALFRELTRLRPDNPRHHNCLGHALANAGRPDEAVAALRRAVALRDDWPVAHLNLGLALALQGNTDEAAREYARAAALEPNYATAHFNLGNALYKQGRFPQAADAYRRAVRLDPYSASGWYSLALAAEKSEGDEAATRLYHRALDLRPDYVEALSNLGAALGRLGRHEEAVLAYEKALDFRADDAVLWNNLAGALSDLGRPGALAAARRAVALGPRVAACRRTLAYCLSQHGDPDGAIAEYRRALELGPGSVRLYNNLGGELMKKGRVAEAADAYGKAAALAPGEASVHDNLGTALAQLNRPAEAAAALRKSIELDARRPTAHYNLGNVLRQQGRLDEAAAEYRRAIALAPDEPEAHVNLGAVLERLNDPDGALAEYRKALALQPRHRQARYNLGLLLLLRKGLAAEAAAEFRRVLEVAPGHAPSHNNLGVALLRLGRTEEAVAAFRKAAELAPREPNHHRNLGVALSRLGRGAEAVAALRRAVALRPDDGLAQYSLGVVLREQGDFAGAAAALEVARARLPAADPRTERAATLLQSAREMTEAERRLPAVLKGEARPEGARELLVLAKVCHGFKELHGAAARFWEEAFALEPGKADDLEAGHRYFAACAAARAGCGLGKDAPAAADRQRWRKKALEWLRADLALWAKRVEGRSDEARRQARAALGRWRQSEGLACVRGPEALAALPAEEREGWRKLWADVDALLARAGAAK